MGKKLNKSSTDGEKTDNTSVDKKIDKKKKFKKKKPTGPSVAKLPGSKTEYSANWKQMLLTIEKDKKPAAKPFLLHSKSFRDKRSKESLAKANLVKENLAKENLAKINLAKVSEAM